LTTENHEVVLHLHDEIGIMPPSSLYGDYGAALHNGADILNLTFLKLTVLLEPYKKTVETVEKAIVLPFSPRLKSWAMRRKKTNL